MASHYIKTLKYLKDTDDIQASPNTSMIPNLSTCHEDFPLIAIFISDIP